MTHNIYPELVRKYYFVTILCDGISSSICEYISRSVLRTRRKLILTYRSKKVTREVHHPLLALGTKVQNEEPLNKSKK